MAIKQDIQKRLKKTFSQNLNYYMTKNGKTRDDLMKALDLPYMTISDWTRGLKYPRMDKLEKLAALFGISKSDLIEEHPERPISPMDEAWEIRQILQSRSEMKMLFDTSLKVSDKDIQKAVRMLEIFTNENEGGSQT